MSRGRSVSFNISRGNIIFTYFLLDEFTLKLNHHYLFTVDKSRMIKLTSKENKGMFD